MIKILIVDDEKLIRQGIKTMLDKNGKGKYEIDLSSDGEEAIEQLNKENYDIVITDIKMPEINGIELMQYMQKNKIKSYILILSGYDNFDYVSQAMKCGAKDYLLKPIKREELFLAMERIEEELKSNEIYLNKISKMDRFIKDFESYELNYILLKEDIREEEINEISSRISSPIFESSYYVGLLKIIELDKAIVKGICKDRINIIIEEFIKHNKTNVETFFDNNNNFVIIAEDIKLYRHIENHLVSLNIFKFYIGLSDKCNTIFQVKKGYNEGIIALKYRILENKSLLIAYSEIINKEKNYKIPLDEINIIGNMLGTDREEEIEVKFRKLLNLETIKKYDISYFYEININIYNLIIKENLSKHFIKEENKILKWERLKEIYEFNTFQEYCSEMRDFIFSMHTYLKTLKDIYGNKTAMEKSIVYLNENYNKDVNLAVISNYVSLNYSYFSQLFKEYTGENFINYLRRLRMDKAKELLNIGQYRINEVSKMVGYTDSKQFTKIFRKLTGVSPSEYKEKSMNSK
ncbi:MAG: response regulator [Clostridiaceae bacterium]|nr:response regulator [Clostridiaceae bacterium]